MKLLLIGIGICLIFPIQAIALQEVSADSARYQIVSAIISTKLYKGGSSGFISLDPVKIILQIRFEGRRHTNGEPTHGIILKALEKTIFAVEYPCRPEYIFEHETNLKHQLGRKMMKKCETYGGEWILGTFPSLAVDVIIEYQERGDNFQIVSYFPVSNEKAEKGSPFRSRDLKSSEEIKKFVIEELSYKIYTSLYSLGYYTDGYGSYIDSRSWQKGYYKN